MTLRNYRIFGLVILQNVSGVLNLKTEPQIKTAPSSLQLPSGETAVFECRVENLGDRHIVWRRGYDVLATERIVLSPDPRITVAVDRDLYSLHLEKIDYQDRGDYVCQISTISGSAKLVSVEHHLDILVPARVESISESAYLTLQEGEDALLECKVSGNPSPSVTWAKQGSERLLYGTNCTGGSCVRIVNVQRSDGGVYMCTAQNGVGEPHTAKIFITVQYKPQISTEEEEELRSDRGYTKLDCDVEGEPKPTVTWYRGITKIQTSKIHKIQETGTKSSLTVADSSPNAFGNYSCVAENILGLSRKYFEIHGRPSPAIFLPMESQPVRDVYNLAWEVRSESKILEYRLLYRKLNQVKSDGSYGGDDWTNVIIPGSEKEDRNRIKKMTWMLENLDRQAEYECLVQAKNKYGWSQPSKMFTFKMMTDPAHSAENQKLSWNVEGSSTQTKPNLHFVYIYYLLYAPLLLF